MKFTRISIALALSAFAATTVAAPTTKSSGPSFYQATNELAIGNGASSDTQYFTGETAVPTGKLLIVENISFEYSAATGQKVMCAMQSSDGDVLFLPTANSELVNAYTPANPQISHGNLITRFIMGEGDVKILCNRDSLSNTAFIYVTVTGELVDAN